MYFVPFPVYYQFPPKIWRGHLTLNTSPFGVIYYVCISTRQYQYVNEI